MRRFFWMFLLLAAPVLAQDLSGHGGPVRAVLPLPDGQHLVSGSFDHAVILWDASAGQARAVARWHRGSVNALALCPMGALRVLVRAGASHFGRRGLARRPRKFWKGIRGRSRGLRLATAFWPRPPGMALSAFGILPMAARKYWKGIAAM